MTRFRMLTLVAVLVTASCGGKPNPALSPSVVTIEIGVVAHQATPSTPVYKVTKGQEIRLKVYSDVADSVHVHGFEKMAAIPQGTIATVEFFANKKGHFNVDMTRSHLKLFQLQVS
jgi:heme/copper-type cytochrome/quinol oxidase subunit 2